MNIFVLILIYLCFIFPAAPEVSDFRLFPVICRVFVVVAMIYARFVICSAAVFINFALLVHAASFAFNIYLEMTKN